MNGTLPQGWDISSRLMARLVFTDGTSIETDGAGWAFDGPEGTIAEGSGFRPSPLSEGWADVLEAFLSFATAEAEAYAYRMGGEPDDGWIFAGPEAAEFLYIHSDEIAVAQADLQPIDA